jgi:hypothetical protein
MSWRVGGFHAYSRPGCRNAIREQITALINPVPTVLSQVTAACPVFPKGVRIRIVHRAKSGQPRVPNVS